MSKFYRSKAFSLLELSIVLLIVAVLIAGVFAGGSMLNSMRLVSAQSLTKSSPVSGIYGLTLWLETTSEKSLKSTERVNGGRISTWYDLNEQQTSRKILTSQSGVMPAYSEVGINGLPSIYFDLLYLSSNYQHLYITIPGYSLLALIRPQFLLCRRPQEIPIAHQFWDGGIVRQSECA